MGNVKIQINKDGCITLDCSTSEAVSIINSLHSSKKTISFENTEEKVKQVKTKKSPGSNHWTQTEMEFITNNLDKPFKRIATSPILKRHNRNAIYLRFSRTRKKANDELASRSLNVPAHTPNYTTDYLDIN